MAMHTARQIVQKYFGVFHRGDAQPARALLHDDLVFEGLGNYAEQMRRRPTKQRVLPEMLARRTSPGPKALFYPHPSWLGIVTVDNRGRIIHRALRGHRRDRGQTLHLLIVSRGGASS